MGVASWSPGLALTNGKIWFDGDFLKGPGGGVPGTPEGISWIEVDATFSRRTAGGTSVVWRPFSTKDAPRLVSALEFSFQGDWDDESDYTAVVLARSRAEPFDFSMGLRIIDTFDAIEDTEYILTRRRAAGLVTSVDETSHPTVFYLDGVIDSGAATLGTAQKITSASGKTGVLQVVYTPLHYVLMRPPNESMVQFNDLQAGVELIEIIQGF